MRIGSLFSGIGGLELGLENAGIGSAVWQVERDPFCRAVLAEHWPEAERFDDVCSVGASVLSPVDLVCGGFPCQDVSSAGARAGLAGERSGLWREYARIVGELLPRWVVVENVASGAALWVDTILGDLEQLGYGTLPIPMQADALGAPYPRARVFVVARRLADADANGEPVQREYAEVAGSPAPSGMACGTWPPSSADGTKLRNEHWRERGPRGEGACVDSDHPWCVTMPDVAGVVPGAPPRVAAQRALGNCVVPICAEVIGWVIKELEGS